MTLWTGHGKRERKLMPTNRNLRWRDRASIVSEIKWKMKKIKFSGNVENCNRIRQPFYGSIDNWNRRRQVFNGSVHNWKKRRQTFRWSVHN